MKQETTIYLQGMTCRLCVDKVEKCLRDQSGVEQAQVDFGARRAAVCYDSQATTPERLCAAVEQTGYGASVIPPVRQYLHPALTLGALWCAYFLLEHFGLLNVLVPSRLADSTMSYGMLFATGLLTSVHCVAMCGGIGLSQSLAGVKRASYKPLLQYHLGRLLSYVTLGAALGALGGLIGSAGGLSYGFQGALKLAAGLAMLLMGLNMLALLPGLPQLPGLRWKRPKGLSPFGIGILNGFMPCGPLQSMLLLALAGGSALRGGLSMLSFCLGTLPLLLGFGSIAAWLGKRFTAAVLKAGAVLIAVFGLSMLSQGGSLTGLFSPEMLLLASEWLFAVLFLRRLPISGRKKALAACLLLACTLCIPRLAPKRQSLDVARMEEDVQVVESTLSSGSYADIQVAAGTPVRWIIYADEEEINGCNNRMLCRDLNLELTFAPGENLLEFTPETPGVYAYSCWMGMIHGTITIE